MEKLVEAVKEAQEFAAHQDGEAEIDEFHSHCKPCLKAGDVRQALRGVFYLHE
jgi:hypothetical protein